MGSFIGKIIKNKIFYVFVGFIILMLPSTIYLTSENSRREVVTALGIDYVSEDEIELTIIQLSEKSAASGTNSSETTSSKGKSLSEAVRNLAIDLGRDIGLTHCEVIVLSDEIVEKDITKYLDYFIRVNNLTTNALLINSKNAKELLQASSQSFKVLSTSLREVVEYSYEFISVADATIDNFYSHYFETEGLTYLPVIKVIESEQTSGGSSGGESSGGESGSSGGSSSGESGSSGGESSGGGSSSSGGGSSGSSSPKKEIKNEGDLILIKDGTKIMDLKKKDIEVLSLLNNEIKEYAIELIGVTDENLTNAGIVLTTVGKNTIVLPRFVNNKPILHYVINITIKNDEIVTEHTEQNFLNSTKSHITDTVKIDLKNEVNKSFSKLINIGKQNKIDFFGVYKMCYRLNYDEWNNYLNSLEEKSEFLNNIIYCFDLNIISKL